MALDPGAIRIGRCKGLQPVLQVIERMDALQVEVHGMACATFLQVDVGVLEPRQHQPSACVHDARARLAKALICASSPSAVTRPRLDASAVTRGRNGSIVRMSPLMMMKSVMMPPACWWHYGAARLACLKPSQNEVSCRERKGPGQNNPEVRRAIAIDIGFNEGAVLGVEIAQPVLPYR